jgi:hypothetical protein
LLFNSTQDFKNALFWLDTQNWKDKGASMCTRYGITCTDALTLSGKRRVLKISLGGNNLMKSLPFGFFSLLAELQVFGCAQNHLTGPLPADLPKATKLTEFEAYGNEFTGSINVFSMIPNFSGRLDLHYNRWARILSKG